VDLLYLSDHQTRRRPQAGTSCVLSWLQFAEWLSKPVRGKDKTAAGGYSPGKYRDNVRHLDKLVYVSALVFDIDVDGGVSRVAGKLSEYSCIVHETFSSTEEAFRCRLIVETRSSMDAWTYTIAHKKFRKILTERHVWPDENATDASRLSYCPVRPEGSEYCFALVNGKPVDAQVLSAGTPHVYYPKDLATPKHLHDKGEIVVTVTRQYVESAVASARHNLQMASEGSRHATLLKESLSLARSELGLSLEDVERALSDTALERMGPTRAHEIRAAIKSGFAKMRERS
jgi:hypothetical protein